MISNFPKKTGWYVLPVIFLLQFAGPGRAHAGQDDTTPSRIVGTTQLHEKDVVVEAPAFQSFRIWTEVLGPQAFQQGPLSGGSFVQQPAMLWRPANPSSAVQVNQENIVDYQAAPVILGAPDLRLMNFDSSGMAWSDSANFQGAQVRLVVLKRNVTQHVLSNLAYAFQPGDKFKIRIAPSFDSLVTLDQVLGSSNNPWRLSRTGQVYPSVGSALSIRAGRVMDVPAEKDKYFEFESQILERIVVNLRHEKLSSQGKSDQPVYRQDSSTESSLVQMVPKGKVPSMELLIGAAGLFK